MKEIYFGFFLWSGQAAVESEINLFAVLIFQVHYSMLNRRYLLQPPSIAEKEESVYWVIVVIQIPRVKVSRPTRYLFDDKPKTAMTPRYW